MPSGFVIRKNQYYDSVFLMSVNKHLSDEKGVQQTAVLMGSEGNKKLLAEIGFENAQIKAAQASDLVVVVVADTDQSCKMFSENSIVSCKEVVRAHCHPTSAPWKMVSWPSRMQI